MGSTFSGPLCHIGAAEAGPKPSCLRPSPSHGPWASQAVPHGAGQLPHYTKPLLSCLTLTCVHSCLSVAESQPLSQPPGQRAPEPREGVLGTCALCTVLPSSRPG